MTVTEPSAARVAPAPLYERIGGKPAIDAAVAELYDRILVDPLLDRFFLDVDIERLREMLAEIVAHAFGGPVAYSGRDVIDVHRGLGIERRHMDAVLGHLVGSLQHLGVPEELIAEAAGIVVPVADAIVEAATTPTTPPAPKSARTRRTKKDTMTTATANGTSSVPSPSHDALAATASARAVLDAVQTNVFVADTHLDLVYANDCAIETLRGLEAELIAAFGVGVDEVLGGSIHRFHKNPARVERILGAADSLPHDAQFTFGGVTLKANINGVRVDGDIVAYVVSWEDVSEKVRTEREMARVLSMMENAPTNMMFADKDLVVQYMNPASLRTLRSIEEHLPCTADEVVGSNIDIFHKNPVHQRTLLADPAKNLPIQSQIQVGPEILDLLVSPITDEQGRHIGAMASWEVITEKVRLEHEVARVQSMMENAPTNMMFADKDLVVQYMNPASLRTLRSIEEHLPCRADEVVGSNIDIFHKNPVHQRTLLADPAKYLPIQSQIQVGPETLDLLVSPITDGNGNHIGAMASWQVITEKLRLERETEEAAERERTAAEDLRQKVDAMLDVVSAAAEGNLTREVPVTGEDAIGQMGDGLARLLQDLRTSVAAIAQNADSLASAAEELNAVSRADGRQRRRDLLAGQRRVGRLRAGVSRTSRRSPPAPRR